jgi:hypothetical protein
VHDRSIAISAQQAQKIAMQSPDQKPNGLPQPGLLPFSARGRCYLGNLGLIGSDHRSLVIHGMILEDGIMEGLDRVSERPVRWMTFTRKTHRPQKEL